MSAVLPNMSLASLPAPAASSACAISVCPLLLAPMSAVLPLLFLASLSAPAASSACAVSMWPSKLAQMSAVSVSYTHLTLPTIYSV